MVTTNKITHTHTAQQSDAPIFPITSSAQCTLALPLRPLRVYNNDTETIYSRTAGAQAMSVCVCMFEGFSLPLKLIRHD